MNGLFRGCGHSATSQGKAARYPNGAREILWQSTFDNMLHEDVIWLAGTRIMRIHVETIKSPPVKGQEVAICMARRCLF